MNTGRTHLPWMSVLLAMQLATGGPAVDSVAAQTFDAVADVWIRQSEPAVCFEDDLISVWSSASSDGAPRYGLITFDLSSLAGLSVTTAELRLFVVDHGSQADKPIRQSVGIVPGTAANATWDSYRTTQEPSAVMLDGLRHSLAAHEGENTYVASTPASAADLRQIQTVIDAGRPLTLVLRPDEDETDYRKDWGDIGYAGHPPQLVVTAAIPCAIATSELPAATRGMPYTAALTTANACGSPLSWTIGDCQLPPGLALDAETGVMSGTPQYGGTYPFTVQLLDSAQRLLDQTDLAIGVTGVMKPAMDFDHDGDVDLEDFDTFAMLFSGPRPVPASCDPGSPPENVLYLAATEDTWVWQSDPDGVHEDDYVSVWSSASPGTQRFGLVTFDVSGLKGKSFGAVSLRLGVSGGGSQASRPIKQTVSIVPGRALKATWNSYQTYQEPFATLLDGLRHDLAAGEGTGTYVAGTLASAADITAIRSVVDYGDGTLTLVMKPSEDGTDYRKDWIDVTHGSPPQLMVVLGPPCYILDSTLPDGQVGALYSAALAASPGCSVSARWDVTQCTLPEGLALDSSTGRIDGTPRYAGTYSFRIRLSDPTLGVSREADYSITIATSESDFDGDGDVDLADFQAFQASLTGPLDPDLDLCWRRYVTECLDTLITYGTDRYGSVHTPMLMAILDVYTRESPEDPLLYDEDIRTEGRPTHGRRSPGGSNLWFDMATLRVMYRVSQVTGDPKYAQAADAYINSVFDRAVKPNGMLVWGSHIYYQAFTDQVGGDPAGQHEMLIYHPEWDAMYRLDPVKTRAEIDGIWEYHVQDKTTGMHNRHDSPGGGDFAFSGGSFALAFAFMYSATGEPHYLDKARLMANWHWSHRDPVTGLVPDQAGGPYAFTCVTGPHVAQLLRCYELTGDTYFRDVAIAEIKAYERYGWDPVKRTYYGMMLLDGTPVPDGTQFNAGYSDQFFPTGYIDVWRTIMFTYEFAVEAAESSLYAYELSADGPATRDPELLTTALHWAEVIETSLPPHLGRRWKAEVEAAMPEVVNTGGTYAENYGRAISFFVNLYHATGDVRHLRRGKLLAREAIEKLYVNGLFRGHPAKPYYESTNGVGILLHALMQLDAFPGKWRLAF